MDIAPRARVSRSRETVVRRHFPGQRPNMTDDLPGGHGSDLDAGPDSHRRAAMDRRRRPTGPLDAFRPAGRRSSVRRRAERRGTYFLDRFDALTLAIIVGLLGLTLVDGLLTVELLDVNSEEFNPLMKHLLARGHGAFFVGKYILTAAGLPFLLVYKNYPMFGTRFRVGYLLPLFLSLYLALVAYQVHLLGLGHGMPAAPSRRPVAAEAVSATGSRVIVAPDLTGGGLP
jgi:hypothetical protein